MTNFEMHKDRILKLAHIKYNECLSPFGYAVASLCGSYDWEVMLKWLFAEYEPTLLENGDNLEPGDWIMVKNDEKAHWAKRVFAYYYNDHFYAAVVPQDLVDHAVYKWKQARLPIEGE